jgi:outer membrane protein assembly factor BamB
LYGANQNGTYSIDIETGDKNWFSDFGGGSQYQPGVALAFGNGALYGANQNGTYSIDIETGDKNWLSDFGGGSQYQPGVALASPVPLPAGIYLFLSGLVGLVVTRFSRRGA